MKQVTIITGKATIVVEEHTNFVKELLTIGDTYLFDNDEQYRLVGPPTQATEEDWNGIVDQKIETDIDEPEVSTTSKDIEIVYFYDYVNKTFFGDCDTATESGISLLKANGVVMGNPIQSTAPVNDMSFYDSQEDYETCLAQWQKAQEKVWSVNTQLFVKV